MGILIGIWIFVLGACIGSFLNVVIIRGLKHEQLVKGSSHCTTCDYELKWYDNIPIISYILLRGKCRKCHQHISLQYPIIESMNAFGWLFLYLKLGLNVQSVVYMLIVSNMLVISVVDIKIMEIPSWPNLIIGVLGILPIIFKYITFKDAIAGMLIVPFILFVVYLIGLFFFHVEAIGMGDIKLELALGLSLGFIPSVVGFYAGCVISLLVTLILKIINKSGGHKIAFGPYLCAGAYVAMLYGEEIGNWALNFMGL